MSRQSSQTNSSTSDGDQGQQITPELVQKVADRVYAMLLQELRLEKERGRLLLGNTAMRQRRGSL